MTLEEINAIMAKQGIKYPELAEQLAVKPEYLRRVLKGDFALTEQLSRHISLALGQTRNRSIIYTIPMPDGQVEALIPGADKMPPEEVRVCLQRVIDYNMRRLNRESDEAMRAALGNMRATVEVAGEPPAVAPLINMRRAASPHEEGGMA